MPTNLIRDQFLKFGQKRPPDKPDRVCLFLHCGANKLFKNSPSKATKGRVILNV